MAGNLLVFVAPSPLLPLREDRLARLGVAPPRVRVEVTATPEALAQRVRQADGTIG